MRTLTIKTIGFDTQETTVVPISCADILFRLLPSSIKQLFDTNPEAMSTYQTYTKSKFVTGKFLEISDEQQGKKAIFTISD